MMLTFVVTFVISLVSQLNYSATLCAEYVTWEVTYLLQLYSHNFIHFKK